MMQRTLNSIVLSAERNNVAKLSWTVQVERLQDVGLKADWRDDARREKHIGPWTLRMLSNSKEFAPALSLIPPPHRHIYYK